MATKKLNAKEIQKKEEELNLLETELKHYTAGDWQPSRYNVFVNRMESIIETLQKNINEIEMSETTANIINHSAILLQQFSDLRKKHF